MNIIDHLSIGVPDIREARRFYDPVLDVLGFKCLAGSESYAAYGVDTVQFLIMIPENGKAATAGNGTHICFLAASKRTVDRFHKLAVAQGGSSAGEPGPRSAYPTDKVYTAYVRDPYGNKLEAIHNGFAI